MSSEQSGEGTSRYVSIAITVVVLAVVVFLGFAVLEGIGDMEECNSELNNRAEEVYGEEYQIVSSDECWDYCVLTATTREQQKEDILHTLKRRGGYVSETALRRSTAGSVEKPLSELTEAGLVERRSGDGLDMTDDFRYVGDDDVEPLPDSVVENRVRKRLYVTGASMDSAAIADDLPVGEARVETALHQLEQQGLVDRGYVSTGFFSQQQWKDTRIGTLPDGRFHQYGTLLPVLAVVMAAVILIGFIQRIRDTPQSKSDPS